MYDEDRDPTEDEDEDAEPSGAIFGEPLDTLLKAGTASQIVPGIPLPWLPPGFPGRH
jgi:hypothetical protein